MVLFQYLKFKKVKSYILVSLLSDLSWSFIFENTKSCKEFLMMLLFVYAFLCSPLDITKNLVQFCI